MNMHPDDAMGFEWQKITVLNSINENLKSIAKSLETKTAQNSTNYTGTHKHRLYQCLYGAGVKYINE